MSNRVERDAICALCLGHWTDHRWGKCPDNSGRMFTGKHESRATSVKELTDEQKGLLNKSVALLSRPITKPYEEVNHPEHYGGENNPLEVIKIIEHYQLGFNLGNTVKYLLRCGKKPGVEAQKDLNKALWYLQREINKYTS